MGKFGFEEVPKSRHDSYQLYYGEKRVAMTYMSRGHREIQDSILSKMAKQIGVNLGIFKEMIDCTIDRRGYLQRVYEREPNRFE